MANPGIGTKFVSVNLNKSYGQPSSFGGSNHHNHNNNGSSAAASNGGTTWRVRATNNGGMVVLSRQSRGGVVSGPKGPRLSVPSPLNLPSLRREHQGSDPSSGALTGAGSGAGGGSGSGSGLPSSVMGWTKKPPVAAATTLLEKDNLPRLAAASLFDSSTRRVGSPSSRHTTDSDRGGETVYMPPGARTGNVSSGGGPLPVTAACAYPPPSLVERAVVLRGEDFPLLQASIPSVTPPAQKQKDLHLKQKQKQSKETSKDQGGKPHQDGAVMNHQHSNSGSQSPLHMHPQMKPRLTPNHSQENSGFGHVSGSLGEEQSQRQEGYLPVPLPIVRLTRTTDWADDERDTGHGILDRYSDRVFSRTTDMQGSRDRELDVPRSGWSRIGTTGEYNPLQIRKNGLSHALGPDREVRDAILSDARGLREVDGGKGLPRDIVRGDLYGKEKLSNREVRDGNSWRGSPLQKDGFASREIGVGNINSGGATRPLGLSRDNGKDKYDRTPSGKGTSQLPAGENAWDSFSSMGNGIQDSSRYAREPYKRDSGYGQVGQNGNHSAVAFSRRGTEQNGRDRYSDLQKGTVPKSLFSSGSKGLPLNDPILNFGREKRLFSNKSKPFLEDPFLKDFQSSSGIDRRDSFSGGLVADVKVFKKKKDVLKQADFHDPVRESFEAELERVQKMQEQERQRVLEEQARALELAWKEEKERERLAREEEETRIRLEEEAREAAWRAEQERLEAAKRAEEQKVAKEEEKMRILLEEERRKEAARQKLLELEARIAKRQAKATQVDKLPLNAGDARMAGMMKERDMSTRVAVDVENVFEDGEGMVERITSSASSDSSSMNNRSFEMGSRTPHTLRDGSSTILDRGRHSNSWKRDMFENGSSSGLLQDQDNGYRSPMRDGFGGGRRLVRKEFYGGGPGIASNTRTFSKIGISEPLMPDDLPHFKGQQRWNYAGDGDHYNRNLEMDAEYHDNQMDNFGDIGWGQGHSRPYSERLFHNSEADGFSFGRSRHSVRQPRVLPPPSLTSIPKISSRATDTELSGSSSFLDSETRHQLAVTRNEQIVERSYGSGFQEKLEQSEMVGASQDNTVSEKLKEENIAAVRCDSQSSLSVSSPPNSPTHLSHDDLEDAGESPILPVDGDQGALSDNDNGVLASDPMTALNSSSPGEDEEWIIGNDEELQEQEEYDEEEDAYQEDDEVHEGDGDNLDTAQEFEDLHAEEENNTNHVDQQHVLGFDEGVEVGIPNSDDFRKSVLGNGEKPMVMQPIFVNGVQETMPFNAQTLVGVAQNGNEGHGPQSENCFSEIGAESSPKMMHETQKALKDLVLQSVNDPQIPVASAGSYVLDGVEVSSSSGLSVQQALTSVANPSSPSAATQPMFSAVPAVHSQTDVPVKLQFGLFSGPSLMPSPVPAIQIGSIQMPLHLHPQVGPSLTQLHSPAQPPFFQFGQLRYTSPISQGLFPLAGPTMSFVQPTVSTHYPFGQDLGVSPCSRSGQGSSVQNTHLNDKAPAIQLEDQTGLKGKPSEENLTKDLNTLPVTDCVEGVLPSQSSTESSLSTENKITCEMHQSADQLIQDSEKKMLRSVANGRVTQDQLHTEPISSQHFPGERAVSGSQAPNTFTGTGRKRHVYSVGPAGSRPSFPSSEASRTDSGSFQRRGRRNIWRAEFRVRENVDRRQTESFRQSNYRGQDDKSNFNTRVTSLSTKGGGRKDAVLNKLTKQVVESESFLSTGSSSTNMVDSKSKNNELPASKRQLSLLDSSCFSGGNPKRNINSEEDVDAPLQSGVVRIFKQPGIEAPSDEDDFIEVRSKRQMLNDRREQREKEIKAKSRIIKAPRKPHSVLQNDMVSSNSSRGATPFDGESCPSGAASGVRSDSSITDGRGLTNVEGSTGFVTCMVSQPLPPIGTPAVITDSQADTRSLNMKSLQTSTIPVKTSGGANLMPGLSFENQNVALGSVSTSLGSWCSGHINQQVMALTQTQFDEAMKPARFDTRVTSLGDHGSMHIEPSKPLTSILTQDKSFSSSASPLNSLLAGEKIQFGAVTSPTILPPSSLSFPNGIGTPVLGRSDVSLDGKSSAPETDCVMYFDKERDSDESCVQLEDPEAEAEAAASAVAVAAITSDELVGNGLDRCSDSVSGVSDVSGLPSEAVVANTRPLTSQARGEESLTVALPADLSVETPALSLWPPLPSPHNSSSAMLSHFPGAPPHSHFPCYEMNPMLGGPIFAFGPPDESGGTQSQLEKSSSSGPWQQYHHSGGMDSFYGPPAGFTGPFISPPPGVQGPPHMVVYNHFAPVGQFGQLGLSFMGTTYVPSGKQPDWKHTPVSSSAVGLSEADINGMNMIPGQRNPNMPAAPIQHLAPGSPLMPLPSPLAMFDMSPFQASTADIQVGPVQAHWSHVPASPLHSVPLSMPLQQQTEGGSTVVSQFSSHALAMEAAGIRYHEVRSSSKAPDGSNSSGRNFPEAGMQFPDELGLGDSSSGSSSVRIPRSRLTSYSSSTLNSKAQNEGKSSSSRSTVATNTSDGGGIGGSSSSNMSSYGFKQQQLHPIGYSATDQRSGGGATQKMGLGNDWQRRVGFQGRNQTTGGDNKNFSAVAAAAAAAKMKQIYVAKPTTKTI